MTAVKNAIDGLRHYEKSDEIVIAWWDRAWFEEMLDRKLDDAEWDIVLGASEKVLEFCDLGDQLVTHAEKELDEYAEWVETMCNKGETNE